MRITIPIAFADDSVWVFVECDDYIDAARLAVTDKEAFLALPCEQFVTDGLFPVSVITGDIIPGLVWANVADVAKHPNLFTSNT